MGRLGAVSVVFPDDSGVINVKVAYGAKGDGTTDDTSALQAAIRDHVGQFKFGILYLPKGTYIISQPLVYMDGNGNWGAYLTLQGQDKDGTIIRLADHAPHFQDPSHPSAMIFTASNRGSANPNSPSYNPGGGGNEGFRNHIMNLSVNSGYGNPGAVGIDYMANNNTRISDVNIFSGDGLGVYGLNIQRGYPGPMLLKNISITGFATAMAVSNSYGVWIEHLLLSGQKTSGIDVNNGSVSIRDLQSTDSVPIIRMPDWTSVVSAVDLNLTNGSPTESAIEMSGQGQNGLQSTLFVRNAICSGYSSLISKNGEPLDGTAEAEWSSTAPINLYHGTIPKSLDLAVVETPSPLETDSSRWVNVLSFGAEPFQPLAASSSIIDNSDAIQAAIDSGAKTVYFPPGLYAISKSIQVRSSVERVLGLNASLMPLNSDFSSASPVIQVNRTSFGTVFIDGLGFANNFWVPGPSGNEVATFGDSTVLDNSSHTLVLTNVDYMGYANTTLAEGGTVYMESVFGYSPMQFINQTVYARNLDPEPVTLKPHVDVFGGQLWVLGLKTEGQSTVLSNEKGARTEILGEVAGVWTNNVPTSTPMISNVDSSLSLTAFRTNPFPNTDYLLQVFEQMGTVPKQLFSALSNMSPSISPPYGAGSSGSIFVDTLQIATQVPNVVGDVQPAAATAITADGLVVGTVTTSASSTVPSGSVISESPIAGTVVNSGASVNLVISSGPQQYLLTTAAYPANTGTVSPHSGSFTAGAMVQLTAKPAAGYIFYSWSGPVANASSISTTVRMNAAANVTATFRPVVPNVVRQTKAMATTAIDNLGLVVGTVTTSASSTVPSGSVISESPIAGTVVNSGASVNLVISSGPQQYLLTTAAYPANTGTVSPHSGSFTAGAMVQLTAKPAAGYIFYSWSGPVANASSVSTTVTISGTANVAATFRRVVPK